KVPRFGLAPCYHVFTGYHDHSQSAYPSTAHIPKSICLNVRFATRLASREQSSEPYLKALTLQRGPRHDISYQQSSLEQGKARWPEVTAQTRTNMGYPHSI